MPKKSNYRRYKKRYRKKKVNYAYTDNAIRRYIRHDIAAAVVNTSIAPFAGAWAFRLSDVSGYDEFTALYDEYRIDEIKVTFHNYGKTEAPTNTTLASTILYTVDFDDDTPPANILELQEHTNCKLLTTRAKKWGVRFRPSVAPMFYNTALTSGYGRKTGAWLDCAKPDIPHYGLKMWINQATDNAEIVAIVPWVQYKLSFRGVR